MFTRWRLPPESSPTWSPARSPQRRSARASADRRRPRRAALEAREQPQVLLHGELAVERRLLGHPADLARGAADRARVGLLDARRGSRAAWSCPRRWGRSRPPARRGPRGSDTPRERLAVAEALDEAARLEHGRPAGGRLGRCCGCACDHLGRIARVKLLFVGDVVGGAGRRALAALLPALREQHRARLRRGQRRELRGRPRDHREDRARVARGRASTRSRSATTPTSTARSTTSSTARSASCARRTTRRATPAAATPWSSATARRLGVVNLSGMVFMERRALAVLRGRRDPRRAARPGRPRARRLPRRGDQREGRDGLAPRRPRDRLRGHPHPRAHRRRARAPRRHRLRHRRGDDRPARRRDRREARAGAGALPHPDAGPLRDLRGRPLAERAC